MTERKWSPRAQAEIDRLNLVIAGVTEANRLLTEQHAADLVIKGQDAATIDDLRRQLGDAQIALAAAQARIEELEDELDGEDPPVGKTLWGANVGGWATTKAETPTAAWTRITAGFGKVNVVRWWANWFFDWADVPAIYGDTALMPNLGSDVSGVNAGQYDDRMRFICEQATRPTFLTFAHEPEDDGYVLADWRAAQMRLAGIKAAVGNPLVKFGPLLMGASYHLTRFAGTGPNPIPAAQRLDFDRSNCDFIGGDFYQWAKADADADHAETVIGPARDLALSYGKRLVIGELGARRRSTVSDSTRARWISETAAMVTANPDLFLAICYYEVDRGAADKIPWCLLPPPGQDPADPANSPLAVAAYRGLCEE